jgi:hypothetical protein
MINPAALMYKKTWERPFTRYDDIHVSRVMTLYWQIKMECDEDFLPRILESVKWVPITLLNGLP